MEQRNTKGFIRDNTLLCKGWYFLSAVLLILSATLLCTVQFSEAQEVLWLRQFGTSVSDDGFKVAADGIGNVYVVGLTAGNLPGQTSSGNGDVFIRKYDSEGNELWTRQFGTPYGYGMDLPYIAVVEPNVYVAGTVYESLPGQISSGNADAFIRKYDSEGNELWTHQFGSSDRRCSY
ncbi:MAG: SBBP repeat-containing protein [Nitrospirae bacterium]|nr:SBBP repeat-containing protein [Nitrospirota bacterium]